jgi:hypothetical protein
MKRGSIYSLIIGFIALMFACSPKMQTYDLSKEYATSLHYQPTPGDEDAVEQEGEEGENLVGIPARTFYGGDVKRGGIWWAGKGISLEKGEVFIFEIDSVGSDSIPFGATFPPIDLLTEEVMIKISARAEGVNGSEPTLHMQVDDANGYQANAKRPSQKIQNSEDFKDYYFDARGIFEQSKPKKHRVNGAMINSLKFFVNPGQGPFSGKIYIKEIKVVSAKTVQK